jgi:thiol-disulfide isomerase/thioredoxin
MIVDLTPETYFNAVTVEGPLHVVMCYGVTCGPCKITMPHYELVAAHFAEHGVTNVKFYRFHQWQPEYKDFINDNGLQTKGVPTFRYYYMGEVVNEEPRSFNDPNDLKQHITSTMQAIESTMGSFDLYES